LDEADAWLTEHDPTWKPPPKYGDFPAGSTTDEWHGDEDDESDEATGVPPFVYLVDNAKPWTPRSVLEKHYRDTHKEERAAYMRAYRARCRAAPVRSDGKRFYANQWRTPEQIEEARAATLAHYYANRDQINARKRAARAAKRKARPT
jgi:hypothetical protein